MKKIVFLLLTLSLVVNQFGLHVQKARAAVQSLGSLDSAVNIGDGLTNSSSNMTRTPGVTIYGRWEDYGGTVTYDDNVGGVYIDGSFIGKYMPGWLSGPIQFGVSTDSLADGTHTVQLKTVGQSMDPQSGSLVSNNYQTPLFTIYVGQPAGPPMGQCVITLAETMNDGNQSMDGQSYRITGPQYNSELSGTLPLPYKPYLGNEVIDTVPMGGMYTYVLSYYDPLTFQETQTAEVVDSTSVSGTCNLVDVEYGNRTVNLSLRYKTRAKLQFK